MSRVMLIFGVLIALVGCASGASRMKHASRSVASADPEKRISITGAVFVRDTSIPSLGVAYRDPDGLIWGEDFPVLTYPKAVAFCKRLGARLPTRQEYKRLASYLGSQTETGYDPHTAGGQEFLFPLVNYEDVFRQWTAEANTRTAFRSAFFFDPKDGRMDYLRQDNEMIPRCVGGRPPLAAPPAKALVVCGQIERIVIPCAGPTCPQFGVKRANGRVVNLVTLDKGIQNQLFALAADHVKACVTGKQSPATLDELLNPISVREE